MSERDKAIVAHITLIGWIIAWVINSNSKDEYTSFYLRQTLGIYIVGIVLKFIPVVGWILSIAAFAFWLLSLVYVIRGEKKVIPFGEYFQDWFKSI